ncbi:MAG: hypothetical protein HC859_05760 [Bacteroidia bacterium]|nr:hypothetical protein [Bacteroidia bacterium]
MKPFSITLIALFAGLSALAQKEVRTYYPQRQLQEVFHVSNQDAEFAGRALSTVL